MKKILSQRSSKMNLRLDTIASFFFRSRRVIEKKKERIAIDYLHRLV